MSRTEDFIQEYTRKCSNLAHFEDLNGNVREESVPWLTPNHVREVVEIAREEIYEWLTNHYRDYMYNPTGKKLEAFFGMDMITDLKQAMKGE